MSKLIKLGHASSATKFGFIAIAGDPIDGGVARKTPTTPAVDCTVLANTEARTCVPKT